MTHATPLSNIVFQRPDGSTGELDLHDTEAIHDVEDSVEASNMADNSVTTDAIAAGAVTTDKIAENAVETENILDGAVTQEKLDSELWDSISRKTTFTGNKKFTATYSIGAGSYADAKFTIPDNYEVIALCGFSSGNYYVAVTQVESTNGSANMRLFNEATTQINNAIATVVVNCRSRG